MQSVSSFWQRLVESQILGPTEVEALRASFASTGLGQNADAVAEWLIAQKKISRYQAAGCVTGAYTAFVWGDFLRVEPIDNGPLKNQWRARHIPSKQRVILLGIDFDASADHGHPAAFVDACEQIFAIPHLLFAPCEILLRDQVAMATLLDRGGTSLSRILAGGTRLSASQSAAIAAAVATDLQYLHAAGLAHGQVCPDTIWIPAKGMAQLLLIPPYLSLDSQRGPLKASMANYAAPELQMTHVNATPQADLYALGCTIFEMFCGRVPFIGDDTIEHKLERHANEPIMSLHDMGGSAQLDQIVRYLMAKSTDVRYRHSETVAEALRPLISIADQPKARGLPEPLQQYMRCAAGRRTAELKKIRTAYPDASAPLPDQIRRVSDARATPSMRSENIQTRISDTALNRPSSEATQAAAAISLPELDARHVGRKKFTRWRIPVIIAYAAASLFAVGLTIAMWRGSLQRTAQRSAVSQQPSNPDSIVVENQAQIPQTVIGAKDSLRKSRSKAGVDASNTIWESPTRGVRTELRYLAPGPKMVLSAHPHRMVVAPWENVLQACNLTPAKLNHSLEKEIGFSAEDIERLDIGFYPQADKLDTVWVCYLSKSQSIQSFESRWETDTSKLYAGEPIYCRGEFWFYKPSGKSKVFCVGKEKYIEQIIDWLGEETQLDDERLDVLASSPHPLASLAQVTDGDRDINLLFDSNFIRSSRETLYKQYGEPFHAAITWLLGPGEHIQAGLLSLNLDKAFFCELQLFCTRDKRPKVVASDLHSRLERAPASLNRFLLGQSISDYSRATLAVAPDMLRALFRYTRFAQHQPRSRLAMLRVYLPVTAAAHLALVAERLLDEVSQPRASTANRVPLSLEQRLSKPITLIFGRDNLRNAIQQVAQESGIEIKIIGEDLEQEGITQNQSFGINLTHQSVQNILTAILKLANPTRGVRLTDDAQKLIYIIKRESPANSPAIWITTRAAAADRGDTIPPIFTADR